MPNHYFLKITDVDLIDELFVYFLIVASIIFLLVVFFTFFYLFRYGVKKRPERPSQKVGNGNVEYSLATLFKTRSILSTISCSPSTGKSKISTFLMQAATRLA